MILTAYHPLSFWTRRWDQIELAAGARHPIFGDELRALRRLQREQEPKSAFVLHVGTSPSPPLALLAWVERAGVEAKLGFKAHTHMLRHPVDTRWPTKGTIRGHFRLILDTKTFSTRCDTRNCRRRGSRVSGANSRDQGTGV
jgi:hypothetical protein